MFTARQCHHLVDLMVPYVVRLVFALLGSAVLLGLTIAAGIMLQRLNLDLRSWSPWLAVLVCALTVGLTEVIAFWAPLPRSAEIRAGIASLFLIISAGVIGGLVSRSYHLAIGLGFSALIVALGLLPVHYLPTSTPNPDRA